MSKEIDIVSRLLEGSSVGTQLRWVVTDVHREAASEITRLRGEVERLTAANKLWVPTTEHQPSVVFVSPSLNPQGE